MGNLDLDSYFEVDSQYYAPHYIVMILESILGCSISDARRDAVCNRIVVYSSQIEEFLDKQFEKENPELKRRLYDFHSKTGRLKKAEIDSASQHFFDWVSASKYHFDPYTLEYFIRYSQIVRNKILLLLNIIQKIGYRRIDAIKDYVDDLDLHFDSRGYILKDDIIRLVIPTVFNIGELKEIVSKANDLDTYLHFKLSIDSLSRLGCSLDDLCPAKSLQIKSLDRGAVSGNVPLSLGQRKEIEEEEKRMLKKASQFPL